MTRAPYYLPALKYNSVVTAALAAGGSASWSHLAPPGNSGRLKFKNPAAPAVKREAEEDWRR